jgi:hypothetical protein
VIQQYVVTDGVLDVGDSAPSFSGPLVHPDGQTTDTSLDELLADGPVLLSFYLN